MIYDKPSAATEQLRQHLEDEIAEIVVTRSMRLIEQNGTPGPEINYAILSALAENIALVLASMTPDGAEMMLDVMRVATAARVQKIRNEVMPFLHQQPGVMQ